MSLGTDYEHLQLGMEHVQATYDHIFFGQPCKPNGDLPIAFASVSLNGTEPLPRSVKLDSPIYADTRFGIFIHPETTAVQYAACLAIGRTRDLTYKEVLELVQDAVLSSTYEGLRRFDRGRKLSAESMRQKYLRMRSFHVPLAVISGWHISGEGGYDQNQCMHYPKEADPESMLRLMRLVAEQESTLLYAKAAIPVSRTPYIS